MELMYSGLVLAIVLTNNPEYSSSQYCRQELCCSEVFSITGERGVLSLLSGYIFFGWYGLEKIKFVERQQLLKLFAHL